MMEATINVRGVNAMVGRFYHNALNVPLKKFRQTLLRDIKTLLPFDAALWGTCDAEAETFHSLSSVGLESDFARALEKTRHLNPMYHHLIANPDAPRDMSDLMGDDEFYSSDLYQSICAPFGIERALGTSCRDPRNRVYNLVVLLRFDRAQVFSEDERRIQQHLVFHMMNAAALAYSVYLSQVSSMEGGSSAAICDRYGICYDIQPSFLSLLAQKYPGWQGGRLPPDLVEALDAGKSQAKGLKLATEPVGDLLCVSAREEGPMDILTKREREIVSSVCRGLSYKEVARPLGIAPSTVSNHIYRVFEKLGVTSRNELAKMFNKARHLH